MDPRYAKLEDNLKSLQARLEDPALIQDAKAYQQTAREFKRVEPMAAKVRELARLSAEKKDAEALLSQSDEEMREMARHELDALAPKIAKLEAELAEFFEPRDPQDDKNVIMEIRAGAGGDEAAIFTGELFRLYSRYAQDKGFAVETYSSSPTGLGGYKEVIFAISGAGAYKHFKYESGVHRVQRVPETEASGRVHTSTSTVAVMPEVDDVEIDINPADLRIDTFRASGAGGQHVNKTESAIRITHIPTNVVVACQDERSQIKNRARAMSMLKSKLYQAQQEKVDAERRQLRRAQVGTGDRSEKIRTYNFPQDRITDHRVNENFHNLPKIMEGFMDDIVKSLWAFEKKLRAEESAAGAGKPS
jgi:peptide chain release factor 1